MGFIGSHGGQFLWVRNLNGGWGGDTPKNFKNFFLQKLLKHHILKVKQLETMFPM